MGALLWGEPRHVPDAQGTRLVLRCQGRSLTCLLSSARANPMLNLPMDLSHDLGFHEDTSSLAR